MRPASGLVTRSSRDAVTSVSTNSGAKRPVRVVVRAVGAEDTSTPPSSSSTIVGTNNALVGGETTLETGEDETTLKTSEDEATLETSEDETTLKTSEDELHSKRVKM